MKEQLIDYLIDEGYANTESSAFKILSVISEEFYEYLLSEALTPEQRAEGRARTARRRAQLGIPEPSAEQTAETMGRIRQRGASSAAAGGRPSSTSMRTSTGASLPETGRRQVLGREARTERQADEILSRDRRTRRGRESEQSRPTASPTFRNAEGKPQELNVTAHSGHSFTMIDPKSTMGKPSVQTTQWTGRDVGVGSRASRQGSSVYSDKIPNPTRRTEKKPQ
jgi:hypothetical protein